jgi:hypothetical protein
MSRLGDSSSVRSCSVKDNKSKGFGAMIIAVLGMQQDRIDARLHRTFNPSRRGREDWHRSRNQCTVSDSIYEHLQGRVDEVICRTTCRLRTNRPIRNLAVDLWPAPLSPAFMPARIASRSFVVASLVRTQPEHRAQDKRCWPFASPQQDRRWPFASRVNVEPGRTTHAQEHCTCSTSPPSPMRASILFLFRT